MKAIVVIVINFYQTFFSFDRGALSVFAPGGACRYNPTCSEYTKQQVKELGVRRGILFGLKRIWSCR